LAHVDFNVDRAVSHARAVNPAIEVLWLSARSGKGLAGWYDWLRRAAGRTRDDRVASGA
jgi:hydrogenase nickel incorporation protein HypB